MQTSETSDEPRNIYRLLTSLIGMRSIGRQNKHGSDSKLALLAWQDLPGNRFCLWNWQTGIFAFANDWFKAFGFGAGNNSPLDHSHECSLTQLETLIHPDDASLAISALKAFRTDSKGGSKIELQFRLRNSNGDYRWVQASGMAIADVDGLLGLAMVYQDTTSQMDAHQELIHQRSIADGLMNSSDLFVLMLNIDGQILRFNPFAAKLTGYAEAEVIGRSWIDCLFRESDRPEMSRLLERVKTNQASKQKRTSIVHKDGRDMELVWHYHPLSDHRGKPTHFAVIGMDVTDRRILEKQLYELAFFDRLTGLCNQTRLEQNLQSMISKRNNSDESLALVYFDVDHFKHVNDALGYSAGDELLQWIACRLRELVKEPDVLARLGEDEFVILLSTHQDEAQVKTLIRELQRVLYQPWEKKSHSFQITISTGVAFYPQHGSDFKTLLQHASIALFNAKDHGRDQLCFYDQQMYLRNLHYIDHVNQLKQAIQEHQFVLHYQLQYDLKSGQPRGAEALIRWQHPHRGLISPQSFIPLAESAGCINEISKWALTEACRQKQLWNEQGIPIDKVAVNLSSYSFRLQNLTDIVDCVLENNGLCGEAIELEITESAVLDNIDEALGKIAQLQQRGITFVLDDFGTGYSSLTHLRLLPVRVIKIDQTFIRTILENTADALIVRAIIDLAHNLELIVVAEGIETVEQMRLLQSFNCDYAQGFLFHYPQPADEIALFDLGHPTINSDLTSDFSNF